MNELERKAPEAEPSMNPEPLEINAGESGETTTAAEAPVQDPEKDETDGQNAAREPRFSKMGKEELVARLREIIESGDMNLHREVSAIKAAFFALRNQETYNELTSFIDAGNDPSAFSAAVDSFESELRELLAVFKEKRAAFLAAEEERKAQNLLKKEALVAELEALSADIDNASSNFPKFQQLQSDFKTDMDVPPSAETEIWKKYQAAVEKYYDCLKINKELRDLDFRKNLESKRQLIEEARTLTELPDVVEAARRLQTLHNEWRAIGPVAKELREEIWEEFKALSTAVHKRHQDHFEERKAREQANEEAKAALCQEVEQLLEVDRANASDWTQATEKILGLQAKWREIGFASKKMNNEIFARFRSACDSFFSKKSEFFQSLKASYADNLAKKTELCERAEALLNEENLKKAADEIVKLQAEWKTVGNAGRRHSDEIWKRFTTACNAVFDRRHEFVNGRRKEENDNLTAKRQVIASLKELPLEGDVKELLAGVRALQDKWNEIGHVPFKVKDELRKEYREICDRIYDVIGERRSSRRMFGFENKVRSIKGDGGKILSEKDRLLKDMERKTADLKTYENNMGFFKFQDSKSNPLLRELEKKSERIRQEIEDIRRKLAILDKSAENTDTDGSTPEA